MSEDRTRLGDLAPLGKSVEEVEQGAQNRHNPSTPREHVADGPLPPIPVLGGSSGTPITGGGTINPDAEGERPSEEQSGRVGEDPTDDR